MTGPIILPAEHPLPAAPHVEFGAWCADKLLEARALSPDATTDEWPWEFNLIQLKARLR